MKRPEMSRWVAIALLCPTIHASPAPPADAAALRDLVTAYEQAVRSGDVPKSGIRKNLAANFTAVLPSGQLIGGYGELSKAENALRTMVGRGAHYDTVQVVVDPAVEVSGDLAVITGQTLNRATAQAGKQMAFTTHWSAVATKEDGGWRLRRHQAVMDPATNPWHQADSAGPGWAMVVAVGLFGCLAGLVLGMVAARWFGRRSPAVGGPASSSANQPGPPEARTRAWEKSAQGDSATPVNRPAPSQGRSWNAAPEADPTATQPADPDLDPPAPAPGEAAPPPSARSAKKRAWEN